MKRLEYDRYGGPDCVHVRWFDLAEPASYEVQVRVLAASINPMDWKIRRGDMWMFTGSKFPRALGTDFAGVVEQIGKKVTRFKPGDAVVGTVGMKASGAFAERVNTKEDLIVKKPASLSFCDAACLPIAGVTAWQVLIKDARLKPGQRVFINGALGSVGQAAVGIARGIGATVAGSVSPNSVEQGGSLGLRPALDYTKPLPPELERSFDVVFDCHGALSLRDGSRLLKKGGRIFDIAPPGSKFLNALFSRSRKVVFSNPKAEHLRQVIDLAADKRLSINVSRRISLEEAPLALASLECGPGLNGKTVIQFPA